MLDKGLAKELRARVCETRNQSRQLTSDVKNAHESMLLHVEEVVSWALFEHSARG